MASESTSTPVTPTENGEAAAAAPAGTEQKAQRERRKHTPPEELYDLTKPIPKVRCIYDYIPGLSGFLFFW